MGKAQVVTEVIEVMKKMDDMAFSGIGLLKAFVVCCGVCLASWKLDEDNATYIPLTISYLKDSKVMVWNAFNSIWLLGQM
jgi:hypothetical protein